MLTKQFLHKFQLEENRLLSFVNTIKSYSKYSFRDTTRFERHIVCYEINSTENVI